MVDIRITEIDLTSPAIDEAIALEKSLNRSQGELVEDVRTPFYLSPIFYYSLAAVIAALAVWGIQEPFFDDNDVEDAIPFVSDYILFGPVAAAIGLAVGLAYGLANRNLSKAAYCALVGLGVGLGATIITTIVANILYGISLQVVVAMMQDEIRNMPDDAMLKPTGFAFWILMTGRGIAWAIVACGGGLALGIALKSRKLVLNGLAGGLIGGLLGGLMFDPIHRFVLDWGTDAAMSRAVGIGSVGLLVGLFIGIFENISKESWLLMLRGPLTGKQFVIFKSPMIIGSAPKADIYLFKDAAIEPQHASIRKAGSHYMITDDGSESGTFINGRRVDRYVLQPNDIISIGETVLKYQERSRN